MTEDHKPNETKPGFQQGSAKPGDRDNPENKQEKLDERLDDALEETFPVQRPGLGEDHQVGRGRASKGAVVGAPSPLCGGGRPLWPS